MKSARFVLSAVMAASVCGMPAWVAAADLDGAAPMAQVVATDRVATATALIRQAKEPSAAIQAYADAMAVAPGDPAVEHAYVQRMVEFGLPEMADTQSLDLLRRQGNDGLAWAVAAYMSAKRNETVVALNDVALAVQYLPNDPFVVRTAAQLVAWYDTRADKAQVPATTQTTVENLRRQLGSGNMYADAYNDAVEAYKKISEGPTTAPSPGAAAGATGSYGPSAPTYTPPTAYTPTYTVPSSLYATYPNPYYSVGLPYDYWWPSPYVGWSNWWWPTFTGAVIIGDGFHHHYHHDFDDVGYFRRHDHDAPFLRHDAVAGFRPGGFHDGFGRLGETPRAFGTGTWGGAARAPFVGSHFDSRVGTRAPVPVGTVAPLSPNRPPVSFGHSGITAPRAVSPQAAAPTVPTWRFPGGAGPAIRPQGSLGGRAIAPMPAPSFRPMAAPMIRSMPAAPLNRVGPPSPGFRFQSAAPHVAPLGGGFGGTHVGGPVGGGAHVGGGMAGGHGGGGGGHR